ncbi:MAG: hypothetical protein ACE5FO_03785 [Parvularculaceae bacterium]
MALMTAPAFFRLLRYAIAIVCVTTVFGLKAAELEARQPIELAKAHAADIDQGQF